MNVPDNDIQAIIKWVKTVPLITRAWIFGSRANGTNREDSDIDIAVEHGAMKGDTNAFTTSIAESGKWREELQGLLSLKIDLQSYIPGETKRIEKALSESSVLIYEKTANNALNTDSAKNAAPVS